MTDTIFDPSKFYYEKYELVSYAEALMRLVEQSEDDGMVAVVTTRRPYTQLRKPLTEVIDRVYEFCLVNKIIGYKNDW